MEYRRLFRGLRIAWTAGFAILCLLLIALWVRSYWWWDSAYGQVMHSPTLIGTSIQGCLTLVFEQQGRSETQIGVVSVSLQEEPDAARNLPPEMKTLGFGIRSFPGGGLVKVPHAFAIILVSVVAAAPWIHRFKRFSLRTLLIATTLVAVGLGIVVYAVK